MLNEKATIILSTVKFSRTKTFWRKLMCNYIYLIMQKKADLKNAAVVDTSNINYYYCSY